MSQRMPLAHLSAGLLDPAEHLEAFAFRRSPGEPDMLPLFCTKTGIAPAYALSGPTSSGPAPHQIKFSLRLRTEQHARMKLTARRLGQTCQAFLIDALNAHLARASDDLLCLE
jgi:hypothetical protein